MALDNTELSFVLREVIDPEITDLVERTPTLYKLIPKGGEINGRGVFLYGKANPNPSLGWFSEGGAYPNGSNSQRIKMNASFTRVAITSRLTRDAMEGADKQAIVNVVTEEIVDDTKSILKEISQQLYGDGSGVKGVIASADNSTKVVTFRTSAVDTTPDISNYANAFGSSQLIKGGEYNFIAGAATGDREDGGGTGESVGAVGDVLTIAATSNVATVSAIGSGSTATFDQTPDDLYRLIDGDMIVSKGSYGKAIKGLDFHIDSGTGTYQNVSRATYPSLRCYVLNAANTGLTVAMLYKVIFQARYARRNNLMEGEYVILSAPTQTHAYALLGDVSSSAYNGTGADTGLVAMPDGGTLDYGFRSFKFAGITWVEDVDCPPHKLFIINFNKFKIHEFKSLSKVFEGNGFLPVPAFTSGGTGSYTDNVLYTMTWKGQLCAKDPNQAGVKIDNLAVTGLAVPTSGFSLSA